MIHYYSKFIVIETCFWERRILNIELLVHISTNQMD